MRLYDRKRFYPAGCYFALLVRKNWHSALHCARSRSWNAGYRVQLLSSLCQTYPQTTQEGLSRGKGAYNRETGRQL